ncbi:molecular chaperone HtpG [uncultured Bilophila sp.]|uniref:molecular chaperone HtpG n=1 Tax=uncultured Bilophila sp. TaxID=529385 RepID=UPI00267041AE|nr:molecular chaperone HtpG [uncultured Bilophila sp.]
MSEQTTNHEFRAETRKVLNILTHSLYSNREIFLRELISNASDALDKLRFLQSQAQHEAIRDADLPLEIRISSDKVQNCLTITDTGIGMTRDEMIENLGTIAHSGSEAFLKEHTQTTEDGKANDASNIIGRFGIGFYSVFMVADKVEVTSLSATGDGPAYRWTSDGTGTFTVEEAPDQADIKRGTTIRAFIKEADKEFLEKYRIEGIIRTHSSFIPFPILVDGERVNTTPALWREPKFSIKKEQYDEFYKFLTYDQKDPLDVLHLSVDAPVQFNALLFIPDITKDYFGAYREHWGLDLYARRVLIQRENKELIPDYLAFLKGVVDTEDLPLNISRETLQENIVLRKISQTISKQILSHLEKMAKDDAEKYNSFWKLHGKVFKLGYSDFVNRDRITPLLRFNSSAMEDADGLTSLDDYISRARESQKEIWYVAAPSREAAKVNPHSEVFRRKGLEVLYLYEPVDEFALETLAKYKDYTFKAVEHADSAVLDSFADTDEQPKAAPLSNEDMNEFDKLLETIRKVLGEQIKDARVSHRLADSPACLVSPDDGVTSSMERLMRVMQKDDSIPQKIFEINRDHPLLRTMLKISKSDPNDPRLAEMIQSLFDSTLLLDGYIKDPHALASRATKLLEQASAWYADVKKL